jgi:hypothetical protein
MRQPQNADHQEDATFAVDTADGADDLFLLCLVLAVEQIYRERKKR